MPSRVFVLDLGTGEISDRLSELLRKDFLVHAGTLRSLSNDIEKADCEVIFVTLSDPGDITVVKQVQKLCPDKPIIGLGLETEASLIVKAAKAGVADFIVLPTSPEKVKLSVQNAIECKRLKNEIDYLRREQDIVYDFDQIIAESPSMKAVIETLKKFSQVDATVLITGETGTGKSFLSGAIHFNSQRRKYPFVKISCTNIPELLLESELFGHEKGAFTGAVRLRVGRIEQARGGTVFLDEIGELPLSLQAKLLRFLEEKRFERVGSNKTIEVDVRIIAATNRNLEKMVEDGTFREDLYYRLNILRVELPPLRKRPQCIIPLAYYFLRLKSQRLRKNIVDFEPQVLEMFQRYHWPGNLRQLANVIERAVILEESQVITSNNVLLPGIHSDKAVPQVKTPDNERQRIIDALEKCNWVQKCAAGLLGVSPRVLNYRIKKYGITHPKWRKHK
ncbi:MAG: sigma-54-dependent Fis family transcriptional regulator [Deltaproteobacteria bacterium]|nr:sigma-54-dependent Fis family transcriptional regulator [Deltaproteobacteria bacterium]MBW2068091.1 sigma-54-dependent Fis family transcriptional regulator [Deltaproteobacteria bacterium]